MKKIILSAFFVLLIMPLFGQRGFASSMGFSAGYSEDGYSVMFNYNHHMNRYSYFNIGLLGTVAIDKETDNYEIPYNVFTLQPGYFLRIYQSSGLKPKNIYVGLGGVGGYEIINNGSNELDNGAIINAKSQFIYGGFAAVEFDWNFSNSFALLIKASQYYHANSDVGKWVPYVGVGLRYYFY